MQRHYFANKGLSSQSYLSKVNQSCPTLFATPWTVAYQAPPSTGFSRQECWSGLPFPSPGDPPDLGIQPRSPALQADALPSEPPGKPVSMLQFKMITGGLYSFQKMEARLLKSNIF